MKTNIFLTTLFLAFLLGGAVQHGTAQQVMDLSGTWSFQLDYDKAGLRERWFEKDLEEKIGLPGSTDEQGFGITSQFGNTLANKSLALLIYNYASA